MSADFYCHNMYNINNYCGSIYLLDDTVKSLVQDASSLHGVLSSASLNLSAWSQTHWSNWKEFFELQWDSKQALSK